MELFEKYKYPILGGIIGLLIAIFIISVGFFKTLLLLICIGVGVFVGFYLKTTGILDKFINKNR
ncbi:DUF2273 domain-containing protein [Streptococcus zalophi]|uniref:DUF2273 domain-containing protein n=1 Tax=Streptococcus zalophi TaxID=640031 RepID=A0A934UDJ3_9STRE|nr:DUF2273 domain-containing protein [Streptococcus zalophi]MBJ8349845.1 DUF2273 domain-containing protein [Streptococcus zalophi]MCR8967612.1 DUF2273 domain-containing protein [Streptococcus zalophi]